MDDLFPKKYFQLPQGYKMIEREHVDAILENGKDFGVTFPIPTKLNIKVKKRRRTRKKRNV